MKGKGTHAFFTWYYVVDVVTPEPHSNIFGTYLELLVDCLLESFQLKQLER